jgi:hypothetical protein
MNKFDDLEKRKEVLKQFGELVGHICGNCKKRGASCSIANCDQGETMMHRAICPAFSLRMWGKSIPEPFFKWLKFCDEPPAKKVTGY